MTDVIEVEYRSKVDGLRAEFNALVSDMKKGGSEINAAADSNTQSFGRTTKTLSELRRQLNDIYKAELELTKARDKSNDPKLIEQYNRKIREAKVDQQNLVKEIQNTENAANKTAKAGSNLVSQFKSVAATIGIAFGVAQIVSFAKEAVQLASKAEGISTAFSKIGGEITLEKLRVATRGATSDLELMQAALRARNFGISTDLLAKGLELAGKVARTTGQDVTYLTNSFVDGLGRKSIRILDNLQISQVDLQKEIKKTGDFNVAVGNIIDRKLKETGVVIDTTADKVARYGAYWQNFLKGSGDFLIGVADGIGRLFDIFTGKLSLLDASIKNQLQLQQKAFLNTSGAIVDAARESESKRLFFLAESSKKILDLTKVLQTSISKEQFEAARLALQNEKQLNDTLRHLNDKAQKEITEDELKEIERRAKLAKELRLKTLEDLLSLVQKTEQEALKSSAITDQQKLDQEREFAEQTAKDARDLAIQTGTQRVIAEAAYNEIVNNNKKIFANKQKEIDDKIAKQKEKDWEDAIDFADKAGQKEADVVIKWQKKRIKDYLKNEEDKKKAIIELEKETAQAVSSIIGSIGQIYSNIAQSKINDSNEAADSEIAALKRQYDNDIITKEQFESRKDKINEQARRKEAQIKKDAFEFQKQASLIQATIATAQGIATALTGDPYTVLARVAIAAAVGAAQIAVIASQPTPKFEKGGKLGGKRHSEGGTLVEAEEGEWFINRKESKKNDPLLAAVNSGRIEKYIWDNYTAPALKAHQQKNTEAKQSSFSDNLAKSMILNSGAFKDTNIVDGLKMIRKNDREIAQFIVKELKNNNSKNPYNF